MVEDRARTGSLISALGAALLAVSVFQPWYALTLTASGAASAQQSLNSVAQQYGNTMFQSQARTLGSAFSALAGQQLATLSAHQALKYLNVVLLVLAAVALVAALLRATAASQLPEASGGQLALVGVLATLCVLFRMVAKPAPQEEVFSLSLAWGVWLALGSSLAIVAGGLWPHREPPTRDAATLEQTWDGLSGWTPGA